MLSNSDSDHEWDGYPEDQVQGCQEGAPGTTNEHANTIYDCTFL